MKSVVKFYARKLSIELQGGLPVNTRSELDTMKRRRAKLGATESWFSRRRGGDREAMKKDHGWAVKKGRPNDQGIRGRKTLPKYSTRKVPRPGRVGTEQEQD